MKVIRKNNHTPDCGALRSVKEGRWTTVWAYPKVVWANKFGNETPKRMNYIPWLKVICNDTCCPAEIWIPNDDFLEKLPKE